MRHEMQLRAGWKIRRWEGRLDDVSDVTREAAAALAESAGGSGAWYSAHMPAQVHEVLLAHDAIPDPRVARNAAEVVWVGESDWLYACLFPTPEHAKREGPVFLRFKGLDTLADVYLNGERVAQCDDMFRRYAIEVSERLAAAGHENLLLLHFHSVPRAIEALEQPSEHREIIRPNKYIRKAYNDFGSYLGARPYFITVGIYDDVILDMPDSAWIKDVWVRSELAEDQSQATVRAMVAVEGDAGTIEWALADPDGDVVAQGALDDPATPIEAVVQAPWLWWPHTHGDPALYSLTISLTGEGHLLDRRTERLGIREVTLRQRDPQTGEARFQFLINGKPLFLQGAGLSPIEGISHVPDAHRTEALIDLAVEANMNLLRVWGGGDIPGDVFYRLCDEKGLLVWQDFMFGYGMYPDDDPAMNERIRLEAEDVVRRLRNHPCILLWVGGNENYMGYDFQFGGEPPIGRRIFEEILPGAVERLDPTRPYHPSSPYGGPAPNWPLAGDWHDYTTVTYSPEAAVPLFASEIGRASAPSLSSLRRFIPDDMLWPDNHDAAVREPGQTAWPAMWQYRSVDGSWEKVGAVEEYPEAATPRELVRVLGTAHGEYLQRRVERERRGAPDGALGAGPVSDVVRRCWGNMVWRLNDTFPIIYWSVVDYYLEPKIPYYYLKRAQAPVLLSFERAADRIHVWVVNDSTDVVQGALRVRRLRFDGTPRGELATEVEVASGRSVRALDLTPLGPVSLRHEFLLAELGALQATHLLIGERYLYLAEAHLEAVWEGDAIRLSTDNMARQVQIEAVGVTGAVLGDNYFDMAPQETRHVPILRTAGADTFVIRCVNAETQTITRP